jgi:acyl-coenzyme A synthetase/AMP-(fatty) acid ligase
MNLLQPFFVEAPVHGAKTAIVEAGGASATFGDLLQRSASLAAAWKKQGVRSGDRVLLALPLGIPLYVSLIALWRLGAVVVFPEPALGIAGLRHAARATRPKAFLAGGVYRALRVLPEIWSIPLMLTPESDAPGAEIVAALAAEHPALLSFTSGSTGRPKTIMRSHGFLARQNACVADLLKPKREDETDLVAFPVFVLANLGLGVTSILPNWNLKRPHAADGHAIATQISQRKITRALIPPSICERLAAAPDAIHLDAIFTGGGPVFPDLLELLSRKLPHADIVSVYGSTEAEPIANQHVKDIGADDWAAMRNGAGLLAGHPIPEIQLDIVDGEIVVTGDHVNKGYVDVRDDRTTKIRRAGEIWHQTGDAGRLDDRGRLWLLGRIDGRVGSIFPFCIEAAARYWPGVVRTALVPIGDRAILAVEGDAALRPEWQREADRIGTMTVVPLTSIPLDRRHGSKIDYPALKQRLGKQR